MSKFFLKHDWAAFWIATLVTFGVYFYTLGPSVGLEDSGELATAAAHLGVPHPPGYPFWTLCSWIFCKIFSFVIYMGHPTPAWAVSCCSSVFGAFAAGCTAMLICRSAQDFIAPSIGSDRSSDQHRISPSAAAWLCCAGGVGGALAFAFSPVEWSQSTIVEIYSLNALFLMLVFLLSYRWMRRPSDKVLWLTAFVFGLGLTNYQVLLFAIVPLAIIIALRNITLFRDFALFLIPVLLTYQILQIGDLSRSQYGMEHDVINKHLPVGVSMREYADKMSVEMYGPYYRSCLDNPSIWRELKKQVEVRVAQARTAKDEKALTELTRIAGLHSAIEQHAPRLDPKVRDDLKAGKFSELTAKTGYCPRPSGVILSLLVLVGSLLAGLWFRQRKRNDLAVKTVLFGGGAGAGLLMLSGLLFVTEQTWSGSYLVTAPLVEPSVYVAVGAFVAAAVVAAVAAFLGTDKPVFKGFAFRNLVIASAVCAGLAVLTVLVCVPAATDVALFGGDYGYTGAAFPWSKSTTVFTLMIVALFALSASVKRGYLFAIPVAGFHIAAFLLLRCGAMNGLTHPSSWWFWWPVAWNFVVLALAWHILPHGRSVAGAAFFAQLGVSFYAYMPIVSDWRNPPMNWAYPRTWEGFKHAITRGQYEAITAQEFASVGDFFKFLKVQMGYYVSDVKLQFTDFLAILAIVPFTCWHVVVKTARRRVVVHLLWVVAGVLGLFLLRDLFGALTDGTSAIGLAFDRFLLIILVSLAVVGCLIVGVKQFLLRPAVSLSRFKTFAFLRPVLRKLRRVRTKGDSVKIAFDAKSVSQQWLISSGACFLMMSVILILLAKVVGDVQDGFIQKVKFISSHAMIAMWIGYGLICVAALIVRYVPSNWRRLVILPLALLLVLVAALPPIVQNYTNDRLVLELGGAEQNGHTFGWQFGAYQLDGAKAIRAQITADEEPLPDPSYPAPMDDHAVFFGGTDPGRFVPTYMIYSADFRPDVYLITQNALADDTYMSVERDLYGDEIWIPAKEDNAAAFQEFTDNLSPEDEKRYGVDKSNGRVQVTGALSVMKINELLVKKMFEKNKARHSFYVEESYPIDWMYDYLTPHGLIMKIEPEKTSMGSADAQWGPLIRKDRDFWDWYTRRLLDDPMFRRDFAAQKSFSKLRSAISGLLHNKWAHAASSQKTADTASTYKDRAEQGFREACLLGPISPEATFHYLQTHLMNRGLNGDFRLARSSLNVIEELLDYIDDMDPNNKRTKDFRTRYVGVWRSIYEAEDKYNQASAADRAEAAFRLACAYSSLAERDSSWAAMRSAERVAQLMQEAMSIVGNDADRLETAAFVFAKVGLYSGAEWAIQRHYAVTRRQNPRFDPILKALQDLRKNQRSK